MCSFFTYLGIGVDPLAQGVSGPSSSCVWNPRVFADEARGWQCPFVLCLQNISHLVDNWGTER